MNISEKMIALAMTEQLIERLKLVKGYLESNTEKDIANASNEIIPMEIRFDNLKGMLTKK